MTKIKVRLDRQFRAQVEMLNQEKMTARIVSVPHGGGYNAEDTVELVQPKKVKNVAVTKTKKNAAGEDEEYQTLEEQKTNEPDGDPEVSKLLSRRFERRTFVRWKGDAQAVKPLISELGRKGWPVETLEGSCAVIAHPKGTRIADTAKVVNVRLLEEQLELQEPQDD